MTNRHITMMVWSVARNGESNRLNITKEVAQYRIDAANSLLKALIDAGLEEDKAYAAVAANMAGNMDEYNRIVSEVAQDTSVNMDKAAVSMAESISINSINAQTSFENLRKKVGDLAEAIKNVAEGKQGGNTGIYGGGGSTSKGGISTNTHSGDFDTTTTTYDLKTLKLDDFQSQLELDIKGYTDAISNIDAQIEVLKNLQLTFDNNGGIRGHGYADQVKQLEKEKEEINNALKDASSTASSSSAKETKEFSEELNWIEKLINRVSTALDKLKDKVSNTYIGWSIRNNSLSKAMEKTNDEINVQQQAYEKYMQKAASVGLSQEYVNKIQNGSLDIEDITDEALNKQIETYTEW